MEKVFEDIKKQQLRENLQTLPVEDKEYRSGMMSTLGDISIDWQLINELDQTK